MKECVLQRLEVGKKGICLAIALALLVGGVSLSLFPQQAQAARAHPAHTQVAAVPTCSQTGCNGKDPYATHCAGSGASYQVLAVAYLEDPNSGYVFDYVQLWWSASCQTNWARVVCLHAPTNCPTVHYDLVSATGADEPKYNTGGVTAQLYLPKTKAQATVLLNGLPSFEAATGWY